MSKVCKGCEKRHVGCHATCEVYRDFREDLEARKDYLAKDKPFISLASEKKEAREKWAFDRRHYKAKKGR